MTGYWELFKCKDEFSALWEAMLCRTEEYKNQKDGYGAKHYAQMSDSIELVWEQAVQDESDVIHIVNPDGGYKTYMISGIPAMLSTVGGEEYVEDTDYEIDYETMIITWIIADPGKESYMIPSLMIDSDIINAYLNRNLIDIETSVYGEKGKWILYACIRHMKMQRSVYRMKNIIAIMAGVPFSKYYANIEIGSGKVKIDYAVIVTTAHEEFLKNNELEGYCFIDTENNRIYDGYYPDIPMSLCHKANLVYENGKYKHIIASEIIEIDGEDSGTMSGELLPIYYVENCDVYEFGKEYDDTPVPLYWKETIDRSTTYIYETDVDMLSPIQLTINDSVILDNDHVRIMSESSIRVYEEALPEPYIFVVGGNIIINGEGGTVRAVIVSGGYNHVGGYYTIEFSSALSLVIDGDYDYIIPRVRKALCRAEYTSDESGNYVTVGIPIDSNALVCARNTADSVYETRLTSVAIDIAKGDETVIYEDAIPMAIGDMIAITSNGEQDYYEIVSSEEESYDITISPLAVRDYSVGDKIYNMRKITKINVLNVAYTQEVGSTELANIEIYMPLWSPSLALNYIEYEPEI